MREDDNGKCVVCEEAKIQHPCKLCRAYLYCSRGCSKKDTKKHKQSCSGVALFLASKTREATNPQELSLISKHLSYVTAKVQDRDEDRAESRASGRSILSAAGLAAKAETKPKTKNNNGQHQRAAGEETSAAAAARSAALKEVEEARAALVAAERSVAGARGNLAGAARETGKLRPESYGDARYWEQRHAKSREGGETYEWYTGYPDEALREAFPRSVRDKKMLVVGCGNSELSEKMCSDGFRDVLSIDTSESAIRQMSARVPLFNTAQTSCRYRVMDAGRLDDLGAETFGGIVDKGTIDAVLSGGLEPARLICREAMRVLEPGGTFLVISNTPAEKLLGPLVSMCGPGSTGDSPPIAVPVAGGACVYAHMIRKKSRSPRKEGGVSSALGQQAGGGAQRPGCSSESGASAAGGRATRPAAVAPTSDCQLSELGPAAESRKPSAGDGGCDGRPRGGVAGGPLPSPEALRERKRDDDVLEKEEGRRPQDTERDRMLRSMGENPAANDSAGAAEQARQDVAKQARHAAEAGRQPLAGGAALSSTLLDEGGPAMLLQGLRSRVRANGATIENSLLQKKAARLLGGGVSSGPPPPPPPPRNRPPPGQAQRQQASQPVVPERQSSLPWGSQDSFNEDGASITYELKFDTELSSSKLSVDINTSRIKASYRRQPGDCKVLVDRELLHKVTAESTWCVEDKKVLTFILCKRIPNTWRRVFKVVPEPPAVIRHGGGTGEASASGARAAVGSTPRQRREVLPAAAGCGALKPVPSPPAVPRKHERSPKAGLVTGRDFKTPVRFLLEDHIGIKKLQLHLSKPQGFKVTDFQVSRAGPELCEVRFVCRDEAGSGLPDARFLQRAHLGRADFSAELASCAGEAVDGLCVVGVPYGAGGAADCGEVDRAERAGDADDEGVRDVARLRCRFCRHPLTPAGRGLAVRAMPSGRWDECIEDMICYDGPQAVPVLASDVNFARPGRCLMAQVEVLLHPSDVVRGAVAVVDGPPLPAAAVAAATASGAAEFSMPEEPDAGLGWRSIECARCDMPLGRPADFPDGHGESGGASAAKEDRGLLLLKHCVLGDDVSAGVRNEARDVTDGGEGPETARGGGGGGGRIENSTKGEEPASGLACTVGLSGTSPPPLPCVFGNRTAIKWLMGEMSHFNERDGCARFIVSANGRSPAAPGGALTLVLVKMDGLVSTSGGSRPGPAHRVAFREESREEAEQRDEEEVRDEAPERAPPPPPPQQGATDGGGGGGCGGGGGGEEEEEEEGTTSCGKMPRKTAAKVPARVLEVSYAEYRAVRERLLETAWAGASSQRLEDPRGYTYSYLF